MLDEDLDVGALGDQRLGGAVQVALAERRVLEELPELRQVTLGRNDVTVRLDCVRAQRFRSLRHPAVGGRHRDQDVVARAGVQGAEHGLDDRLAGLDVHHLVAERVAVQRRLLGGHHVRQAHVGVAQDQPAAGHDVRFRPDLLGEEVVQLQVPRLERVVRSGGLVAQLPHGRVDDGRRDVAVVEQRRVGGEALLAHQLLEVEPAFLVPVLGVTLRRNVAELSVERHDRPPEVLAPDLGLWSSPSAGQQRGCDEHGRRSPSEVSKQIN